MKTFLLVTAVLMAVTALAPAGASALPPCPVEPIVAQSLCEDPPPDPDPDPGPVYGNLVASVSTAPAATAGAPGFDDENLTYAVVIENQDAEHAATSVKLTSEITAGSATFVSSSASQGGCDGQTCNLGTIPSGGQASVTMVMRPAAGTLSNKFFATSAEVNGDIEVKTNTIRTAAGSAAIDWSMPERSRDANNDGLIDAGPPAGGYTPSSWSVELDACASHGGRRSITNYRWEVQGLPAQDGSSCKHTVQVPREQVYPTKLTVTLSDGSTLVANRDVKVVDRFIVVMGDSYASGEGDPQTFIRWAPNVVLEWPTWDDVRCHRSMYASSARAARILETSDAHSSVTYLSRACSGATIAKGILGGYHGIEAADSAPNLPPQLQQVRSVVGSARIDNLLISIGGNDVGFADIIADCMWPGDCFDNTTLVNNFNAAIEELKAVQYPAMRTAIEDPGIGLNVDSTFITEYPDFTTGPLGGRCNTIGGDIAPLPFGINFDEANWASGTVLAGITSALKSQVTAARNAGLDWNYVGGVQDAWTRTGQYGHGYCVGDPGVRDPNRWVRTFKDSCDLQGKPAGWVNGVYFCLSSSTTGMFHPNEAGHFAIGQRYIASLAPKEPALDPPAGGGGDPGSGDPGSGDPGTGDPPPPPPPIAPIGARPLPTEPIVGGTPPVKKAGRCARLKGTKRTKCIRKACARYNGRTNKARLRYRACVKAATRKA